MDLLRDTVGGSALQASMADVRIFHSDGWLAAGKVTPMSVL